MSTEVIGRLTIFANDGGRSGDGVLRADIRHILAEHAAALRSYHKLLKRLEQAEAILDRFRESAIAGARSWDDAKLYAAYREAVEHCWHDWQGESRQAESQSVNVRPNMELIHKLTDQLIAQLRKAGREPEPFTLTHDEIDGWRNQFDGEPIPVSMLCFRGIPIRECSGRSLNERG